MALKSIVQLIVVLHLTGVLLANRVSCQCQTVSTSPAGVWADDLVIPDMIYAYNRFVQTSMIDFINILLM